MLRAPARAGRTLRACFAAFLIAWIGLAPVAAQPRAPQRLDDSASPAARLMVTPRWMYDSAGRDLSDEQINALIAEIRSAEFRLNTEAFVGRQANIFLRLENPVRGLRTPSALRVQWATRGKLRPGLLLPGERFQVFGGTITEKRITEFFDFTIQIDGRHLDGGLEFQPVFEIEILN